MGMNIPFGQAEHTYELHLPFSAYTVNNMIHDPAKRKRNLSKHKIDLPDCAAAFDGPMLTREDSRDNYGEQRLISMGQAHGTIVVLVWTDTDDGPRLISCREAKTYEKEAYFNAYP
jgi:uncharacterized DUF497 family protein